MHSSMTEHVKNPPDGAEARRAAEDSEWKAKSFVKQLFSGRLRLDLIHPFPEAPERPEFRAVYDRMAAFLKSEVDPDAIDRNGKIPPELLARMIPLGAFGLKIPVEYGGLGLKQREYVEIMKLMSSWDANLAALISAHQSIGVPQPLMLFGTPEQKKKFFPRLAQGAISAFALTEPHVGSDPSSLSTRADRTPEGDYVLNGEKLWCTNGTIADLYVVMAKHPDTKKISAFIVERNWPGVEVVIRCHFMGLKALENGVIRFTNVRVPKENLLLAEGRGFKLALVTLNTGRLTLPATCAAFAKRCLEISRVWCNERVQWGQQIGKHDAIAQHLTEIAATAFAMEAVSDLSSSLCDLPDRDIRLEAATAKMWNSEQGWKLVDRALQIRGGRGYETADSLRARGEKGVPVERMLRDYRIYLIWEGSSEIMRHYIGREALEPDPTRARLEARGAKEKAGKRFEEFGPLAGHVRYLEQTAQRLSGTIVQLEERHGAELEKRQALVGRLVDVGADLYAMSAAVSRAEQMRRSGRAEAKSAVELADVFCRMTRRHVEASFRALRSNDDVVRYKTARRILAGKHLWMEDGLVPAETTVRPAARRARKKALVPAGA